MSEFCCVPGCGTPFIAPINILYAFAKVTGEEPLVPISMVGWQNGAINDMEVGEEISDTPIGVALVWLSVTEKKVYDIDVEFSSQFKDLLADYIKRGFKNRKGEKVTYTNFHVSLYPGGIARFHLLSSVKVKCLDFSFRGTLTSEFDYAYLTQYSSDQEVTSIEEYCNRYFDDDEELLQKAELVNKQALPNNLWYEYYARYDYEICFVFEDSNCNLIFWAPKFSNAESFSCQNGVNNDIIIENPATLCTLNLWWQNNQYRYTAYFYFNEDEVLPLFEKGFTEHPNQHGVFRIQVGKYNNSFELSLCLGNEMYPLVKTEIRVFRDKLSDLMGESELIYKNYEGNHLNKFVGL